MDNKTKTHERNAYSTVAAAGGVIALGALTGMYCIKLQSYLGNYKLTLPLFERFKTLF